MIRLVKYAAVKVWATTVVLVILLGLVVAAARLMLPLAADYRGEIEKLLSEESELDVRIGGLAARLDGLDPELVLTDVTIGDPDNKAARLQLARVHIEFDLLKSLIAGRLSTGEATVAGARLAFTRLPDGSLTLTGLQGIEETGAGADDTGWFFLKVAELRIIASEISWHDRAQGAEPLHFSDVHMLFVNDGDRHRTHVRARIAELEDAWFELVNDFHGDPSEPHTVTGDVYLKGTNLALDRLFGAYGFQALRVEAGDADVEFWAHVDRGVIRSVSGTADLRQLELARHKPAAADPRLGPTDVRAGIAWQRQADGWRLDVYDLEVERAERAWPSTEFSLHLNGSWDKEGSLRAGFEFLRVQDLFAVAWPFLPADSDLARVAAAIDAQADLHRLQFIVDKRDAGAAWFARGRISGLQTRAWQDFPGVSGLDLRFRADQDQGTAELQSRDVAVSFPGLFRDALRLAELSGRVNWHRQPDGTLVTESPSLVAYNSDIRTRTRMRLLLPTDGSSPFLDLQTDFRDADASAVSGYLPVGVLSRGSVDWFDRALVSGRIESGSALLRGPLDDYPFKKDEGRFEVLFGVSDLILDYAEGWPRLEDAIAEFRFLNQGMSFRVMQGHLLASSIGEAEGRIGDLKRTSPLKMKAALTGPLSDYLRVLSDPPLAGEFGGYVKDIKVTGQAGTLLDLSIPIDDGSPLSVKGKLSFDGAGLTQTRPDIRLAGLKGDLEFTQDGIWCTGVRAKSFGFSWAIDVETLAPDSGGEGMTRISARTQVPVSELARRYPGSGLQHLEGDAGIELRADVVHGATIEQVTALADLTRVAVNLPQPLGKAAGAKGRLRVSTELSDRPVKQVDLKYDDRLSAALVFTRKPGDDMSLERGVIRFGPRPAQPRHGQGFWLEGSLEYLDLDSWRDWTAAQIGEGETADSWMARLKGVDMEVGQLLFNGQTYGNLDLDVLRTDKAWTGFVSADLLAGNLYLPHDFSTGPLVAKLEFLDLATVTGEDGESPEGRHAWGRGDRDPRELPALDLTVKELRMNGRVIGQVVLKSERVPTGQHMSRLSIDGPNLNLSGSGHWVITEESQITEIVLVLESERLGKLLEDLGYENQIKKATTKLDAALRWPGAPYDFDLAEVAGTLNTRIGKGRLLDVGPGLGRVFGLINFGALQRRLSLDFSDLFGKGFGFDEIKAGFLLKDGDAHTDDAFIEGPAARIDVSGRTGLVDRDYDQKVVVTPRVSGSIPVAGALAGGPVVGAALLVAQQIVGKEVDRMTRYQYAVTGSWEDPVFTREKIDDGWSLSHLFGPPDENREEDQEDTEIGGGYLDH